MKHTDNRSTAKKTSPYTRMKVSEKKKEIAERAARTDKMIFQPARIHATVDTRPAFDEYYQTGDIPTLLSDLHEAILEADIEPSERTDGYFIGSQISAQIAIELDEKLLSNSKTVKKLRKLPYNRFDFVKFFKSLNLNWDFDCAIPTFVPRELPKVTAESLEENTNEESLEDAVEVAEVTRLLGPEPSLNQVRNTIFRHYGISLGRSIGRGAFGEAFVGHVVNTGQRVAVKIMQPDILDIYKYNKAEVDHSIAVSSHPRFPSFYEHGITLGGVEYLIMELALGTLFDVHDKEAGEHKYLAFFGRQLMEAASHLALLGICNRDLKPENIFISSTGDILIGDWGMSALSGRSRTDVGSPAFMAPEVIASTGDLYDGVLADLWVCGKILYFLKFNRLSSDRDEMEDKMQTLLTGSKKDRLLFDVLNSLLQVDPARRLSAAQMLKHEYWQYACTAEKALQKFKEEKQANK